jgi:uncharacterized protein
MSFADRYGPWALVTGASEGTGRSFARQIAQKGLPSILVARRAEPLAALAKEIRAESGVECVTASIDLSAPDAYDRIVAAVGKREVGLLVCNAGADPNGSRFLDRDVSAWVDLVHLNVLTTLKCAHHFGGLMKQRGKGGLLLVSSGACYGGASFLAAYSASKAFVTSFTEGLWAELQPHGVDVLTLVMSQTDTPAFRALLAEKGLPFPDNTASPDEVAKLGLERLGHGPIQNWGLEDDAAGFGFASAKARRERVLLIDSMTKPIFGDS